MVGLKRKIPMEKIEKRENRSVAFTKRREGLYSKASELCLLFDAQIAILATPPNSNSYVSFYSLGHSSVDDVVRAFLENRVPSPTNGRVSKRFGSRRKNGCLAGKKRGRGLGFWWEEEGFEGSENTEDLGDAIGEILRLKNDVNLRLKTMKDHEDSSGDILRDLVEILNEPDQESDQSPLDPEKLQEFKFQCLGDEDAEEVFRYLDGSNQTQTPENESTKNRAFRHEGCRDEEGEGFDDFLRDLCIDAV